MTVDLNSLPLFTSVAISSIPVLLVVIAFFGKKSFESLERIATSVTTLQVGHAELKVRVETLEDTVDEHEKRLNQIPCNVCPDNKAL